VRLVDVNGNPIGNTAPDPDLYVPEFVGSVFALVNKITQKPEASFLFLSDSASINSLSKDEKAQTSLMSVIASYATFTYAIKVKKISQEEFQQSDPSVLKDELLSRCDIAPIGSLPFDALFELNPDLIQSISNEQAQTTEVKEGE
jgi:hypothetical protein